MFVLERKTVCPLVSLSWRVCIRYWGSCSFFRVSLRFGESSYAKLHPVRIRGTYVRERVEKFATELDSLLVSGEFSSDYVLP